MSETKNASHVPPLNKSDAPAEAKPILEKIEEKFGQSMNIFNTLAYQPEILSGVTTIDNGLQNDLPQTYRELAYVKASHVNNCEYCSHYHEQAATQTGITQSQLDELDKFESSDAFDEKEKAVMRYAEELTRAADVKPETIESVKEFLNETQLVTLAATVGLANFTNRFNHGLGIQLP